MLFQNNMNYNATPISQLPSREPVENDSALMDQVMREAYNDHVQPSYEAEAPLQMPEQAPVPEPNSIIPSFNIQEIIMQFQDVIIVTVLFFVFQTEIMKTFMTHNMPNTFLGDNQLKQIIFKAIVAGAAFYGIKNFLSKE